MSVEIEPNAQEPRRQVDGTVTADLIGADFVPSRRTGCASVTLDGKTVIAAAPFQPCHLLNESAGMLWERIDGSTSLGSITAELSDLTGADPQVIEADVVGLARHLGTVGLLEGVIPPQSSPADATLPATVAPGEDLDFSGVVDRAGSPFRPDTLQAGKVALLNWGFACGYCQQIAGTVAGLRGPLTERGVGLALVVSDERSGIDERLDEAGLADVDVLFASSEAALFAGLGTPAAYLVDDDGTLAEPLAYGALEVPEMLYRLAGVEMPTPDPNVKYLAGGGGVCGPSAASVPTRSTKWEGVAAFDVKDVRVGLRYNNEATLQLLEKLLPGARVDDPSVTDNLSVAAYEKGEASSSRLNLLVRNGLQTVRTRSRRRLLRGLLGYMDMLTGDADPDLLSVEGIAVVRDGEAFVLPSLLYNMWSLVQPKLTRLGLRPVDRPFVLIDPADAAIVVPEPSLPYDKSVVDTCEPETSEDPLEVPPGRYPMRRWLLNGGERPDGPVGHVDAVVLAMCYVNVAGSLESALDRLTGMFSKCEGYALEYVSVDDYPKKLAGVLGAEL